MTGLKKTAVFGSVMVLCGLLSACSGSGKEGSGSSNAGKTYNGQDVSAPVELIMYYLGDKNPDEDVVMAEVNKILSEKINAVIIIKNISLSDYQTKYSLTIAGGEKLDIIYTSTWAFYQTEANKGAFAEVTDQVLTDYMPLTRLYQDSVSFAQARIGGKTYFVPVNMANVNASAMVIRGDRREKYGLPEIKTLDDMEAYYRAISADKNSGVSFAFHASQHNDDLRTILFLEFHNYVQMKGALQNYFTYQYDESIGADDLFWIYSSGAYLEWAKRMKAWADMGAWSKSAMANATSVRDAFVNGTSASLAQNLGTVGSAASQILTTHPEWKPELVDLSAGATRFYLSYTGDGFAVTANSQNQARAFMALDLLKFDETLYYLLRNGIEGVHYHKEGNGLWSKGPSYDNWPFGNALSWGVKTKPPPPKGGGFFSG
jgi:putative aldouronate transport system substrate-binding protein